MNYMDQSNTRLELGSYLNAPQKQEKTWKTFQARERRKCATLAAA